MNYAALVGPLLGALLGPTIFALGCYFAVRPESSHEFYLRYLDVDSRKPWAKKVTPHQLTVVGVAFAFIGIVVLFGSAKFILAQWP